MARRKIIFGVGAGVISTGIEGLAGLSNIHFFLRYLPEKAAGFWMLTVTLGGFLMLAQTSIVPVIARFTAQQFGVEGNLSGSLVSIRRLTHRLVFALLGVGLVAYAGYLHPVGRENNLGTAAAASWFTYCIGLLCGLDASSRFAVLNGLGEVGWDKVTRIVTSAAGGLLTWISLRWGFGLLGLGVTFLFQSLVTLGFSEYLLRRHGGIPPSTETAPSLGWIQWFRRHREASPTRVAADPAHWRQLIVETGKLLGLAFIGYLVVNFGTLAIERRFGSEVVSKFAPLARIGTLLAGVASLIPQMLYPFVARAWASGHYRSHRRYVLGGVGLAVGTYLLSSMIVWLSAPYLIPLWLGPGRYLGPTVLGLILLNYGLLVVNVAISSPVLASVGNAFLGPSLLNVALVVPLVWLFTGWWGVSGAPLGMLVGSIVPSLWVILQSRELMLNHGREEVLSPSLNLQKEGMRGNSGKISV